MNGKAVKNKIVRAFGKSILNAGKISRRRLKDIVFNDHARLVRLNNIIHPLIIKPPSLSGAMIVKAVVLSPP